MLYSWIFCLLLAIAVFSCDCVSDISDCNFCCLDSYSDLIWALRSSGASLLITMLATALPIAPMPAATVPDFRFSAVSDFWVAHSLASGPDGFAIAFDRDVNAPSVLPIAISSYSPDVAASSISSDSIPKGRSKATLRCFRSVASFIYSDFRSVRFDGGSSMFVVPPEKFFPSP